MAKVVLKTDLHCSSCKEKLEQVTAGADAVSKINVDLSASPVLVQMEGEGLTEGKAKYYIQKAGYNVLDEYSGQGFWENRRTWKRASFNTLNCLIGCSIGDFGMIIYLQAYHPSTSIFWQMTLAIIAGLITSIALETIILKSREEFGWWDALKTAFGMSFISMIGMEIAMNTTDFMITGAKADFSDPIYWLALLAALVAGFIAPLPYNYYKLEKFKKACH